MWASHLDGQYLGQAAEGPQDTAALTTVPETGPDGSQAPSLVAPQRIILGLTPQQWLILLLLAGAIYVASKRRGSS